MVKSIAIPVVMPVGRRTFSIARYTLLEAWRNRFLLTLAGLVFALVLVSVFVRQQTLTESDRVQAAFLASTLRATSVFVMTIYVLQGSLREFQEKVLELVLSLDLPRSSYILGKFVGYAVLGTVCAAITALPLLSVAGIGNVLIWGFTLTLELWLVAATALFCMTSFTQLLPAAAFVLAFYLLGRSITAIQLMSRSTLGEPGLARDFGAMLADALALVMPRVDAFTQTAWLVGAHATPFSVTAAVTQTGIYVVLLLAAAIFDLHRKNL